MLPLLLLLTQLAGAFLLGYLAFGVALPAAWHDRGFPCDLLGLGVSPHAFHRMVLAERGVNRFAASASALTTASVVSGFLIAHWVLGTFARRSSSHTWLVVIASIVQQGADRVFRASLVNEWGFGFERAKYFFAPNQAAQFGLCASLCVTLSLAIGMCLRVFGSRFDGFYPEFATKAVPRALIAFGSSFIWFRWVVNPVSISGVAMRLGWTASSSNSSAAMEELFSVQSLDNFAVVASSTHTLALALGMVFGYVVNDFFFTLAEANVILTSSVVIAPILVLVSCLSFWFQFASVHKVEYIAKYAALAFDDPASQGFATLAGSSYGLFFLLGVLVNEIHSVPTTFSHAVDYVMPNVRRMGGVKVVHDEMEDTNNANSFAPALTLAIVCFFAVLYTANPLLLGMRFHQIQAFGNYVANWVPNKWAEFYDNYTKEQLMFLSLPVLLLTEVPLTLFTVLDYVKLQRLDKYRMHYSLLDDKRPRLYPSNAELWRCVKHHFGNLFGVYGTAFVLGTGAGCYLQIFPFKMTREIPSYWFLECVVNSLLADQMFYWIHRVEHLKQFYAYAHKTHHEWIYTIGLAQHYMSRVEAALYILPPVIPPVLFGSHLAVVWATMWWISVNGTISHSAYCIPLLAHLKLPFLDGRAHDLHHLRFTVNYSAVYDFTDKMWGTYRYEPIIYVDGVNAELACDDQQKRRALSDIKDNDDPFEYENVKNDAVYVKVARA